MKYLELVFQCMPFAEITKGNESEIYQNLYLLQNKPKNEFTNKTLFWCNDLLKETENHSLAKVSEIRYRLTLFIDYLNTLDKPQTKLDNLISKSINLDEITKAENRFQFAALKDQYDFEFTIWLQENKDLKHGDAEHYKSLVTEDNWLLFLKYKKHLEDRTKTEFEKEKQRRKDFIDNILPPPKAFTGLLKDLKPYIEDCSQSDLNTIIEHKVLPIGRKSILWNGSKADAIRFIEHFEITKAQFKNMFYFEDGKPLLAGHKDKTGTPSDLTDILKKY